jgi:hypothetical protein
MNARQAAALIWICWCLMFLPMWPFLSSCSFQRAEVAQEAKDKMVGMSKEQVLVCMGAPSQRAVAGETEVWSYPSGGDSRTLGTAHASIDASGNANAFGSSYTQHRYCIVNVVMTGDRVSAVNYTGRTGGWATHGEQCAFAVQNCVQQ